MTDTQALHIPHQAPRDAVPAQHGPVVIDGSRPPTDPDLREFAEDLLAGLTAGLEEVVAQAPVAGTTGQPTAPGPSRMRPLEHALLARVAEMDTEKRARVVAGARLSATASAENRRRLLGPSGRPAAGPGESVLRAATAAVPDRALVRALARIATTSDTDVAVEAGDPQRPGGTKAVTGRRIVVQESPAPVERTYGRFRDKLGDKTDTPRLVKDHRGRTVRILSCERGLVVQSSEHEAFAIWGTVYRKFETEGGIAQFRGGPPVSHVQAFDDGGAGAEFYDGYSLYRRKGGRVRVLHGVVRKEWQARGGRSTVGYPDSDIRVTSDGAGRWCRFTGGVVVWKPGLGAHWIPGAASDLWLKAGGVSSTLGYPVAPATMNQAAAHQQNPGRPFLHMRFQGGAIVQPTGDLPPRAHYPIQEVELVLRSVHIKRKAQEGAKRVTRDKVFVGGSLLGLDGKPTVVNSTAIAKVKQGQTETVDRVLARWPLVMNTFPGWPATFAFTALFWEDDPGRGGQELVLRAWEEINDRIQDAVAEGAKKLEQLVAAYTGPALGALAGTVVGAIGGWLLAQLVKKLAALVADNTFEPVTVVGRLDDAWQEGKLIGQPVEVRVEESNPPGNQKPGIYIATFAFTSGTSH